MPRSLLLLTTLSTLLATSTEARNLSPIPDLFAAIEAQAVAMVRSPGEEPLVLWRVRVPSTKRSDDAASPDLPYRMIQFDANWTPQGTVDEGTPRSLVRPARDGGYQGYVLAPRPAEGTAAFRVGGLVVERNQARMSRVSLRELGSTDIGAVPAAKTVFAGVRVSTSVQSMERRQGTIRGAYPFRASSPEGELSGHILVPRTRYDLQTDSVARLEMTSPPPAGGATLVFRGRRGRVMGTISTDGGSWPRAYLRELDWEHRPGNMTITVIPHRDVGGLHTGPLQPPSQGATNVFGVPLD